MAKLPEPVLTSEAKAILDKITAERGPMRGGPYASLMHHPALPDDVIERVRTRGDLATLPPRYAGPTPLPDGTPAPF